MDKQIVDSTWSEFKSVCDDKSLFMQYNTIGNDYNLWAQDGIVLYTSAIRKTIPANTDQEDFEDNYKDDCNQVLTPKTNDGKSYVRAESRPLNMTTCFTCRGDSSTVIGGGTKLMWDATNGGDTFVSNGDGTKTLKIDFGFNDEVCIKEGAIYFFDTEWYGELEMWTYIPASIHPSGNDTYIDKFVISHFFKGDCPMGDELNTECASAEIPSYIRHQLWITLQSTDTTSRGFVSLEVYREGTV